MRRSLRARLWLGVLATLVACAASLTAAAQPANATTFVGYTTELTNVAEGTRITVPPAWQTLTDAVYHTGKCATVPGVTRAGEVWNELYVPLGGTKYNSLKFFLYTQYSPGVAAALQAYHTLSAHLPQCNELYQYESMTAAQAFNAVACGPLSIWQNVAYCQQYRRHPDDPVVNAFGMNLGICRQPRFNGGDAQGPKGFADWHDVGGTFLRKVDLVDELNQRIGFHLLPGSFTLPVELRDFTMLSGVFNVDRKTLQPAQDEPEWRGYGNVPTTNQAYYMNFQGFAIMARTLGLPYTLGQDNYASDLVIGQKIDKALQDGGTPIDDYVKSMMTSACANTTQVADILEGPWGSAPNFDLLCGVRSRHFWSDMGNGESIFDFIASQNTHTPKALRDNPFLPSVILQEAYSNTGDVVIGNPQDNCAPLLTLKAHLPGSDHDARYNHFVQLVQHLSTVFGG